MPLQHTRLGLGTPFPEESFAKLRSTLWLTLSRLQQKSGFCGISERNIFVTCRRFQKLSILRMLQQMTCAIDAIEEHLCEGLSDCG